MNQKIEDILLKYRHSQQDKLIPILQEIHDEVGLLSEDAIVAVSNFLQIPASKVYGLATFYNQFRFEAKGQYHFQVCHGTACHMLGAVSVIEFLEKNLRVKAGKTSRDGLYSLEVVPCMGACAHSPVIAMNEKYYTRINLNSLKELLSEIAEGGV